MEDENGQVAQQDHVMADDQKESVGGSNEVDVRTNGQDHVDQDGSKNNIASYYATKRIQKRERLEREVADLRAMVSQLVDLSKQSTPHQNQQASNGSQKQTDFWTDPEGYFSSRDAALKADLQNVLLQQAQLSEKQKGYQSANQYIESQEDVQSDGDLEEIKDIASRYRLHRIAQEDPMLAANMALDYWRKEKGISSPLQSSKPSKSQAAGIQGSISASGKKIWSLDEIRQLRDDPEKYEKLRDEYLTAVKEGRVRLK